MAKYQIIELNSKNKKGLYVKYKHENGKTSYYKLREGIPIERIITHYTKEETKKKRIKIPKRRNIEQQIKRAIRTITITNTDSTTLKKAKKGLFKTIVKDEQILEILTTDHNLNKIKHRFEVKLTAYGREGELFTARKMNITPDRAINEINQHVKKGTYYDYAKNLKNIGWTTSHLQKGNITRLLISITFRKG